jgi:DNA-binding LacI/PurR family transcriptional regulator
MKDMNFRTGNGPLYGELARELRSRIESGQYLESGYLPQERALAKEFSVSRNTVRGALETLRKEQLIKKVQGKGIMLMKSALKIRKICEYVVLSYNTPTLSQFLLVMLHELEDQAKMMNAELVYMTLPGDSEEDIMLVQRRIRKRNKPFGIVLVGRYTCPLLEKLREALPWPLVLIGDVYGTNSRPAEAVVSQVVGNDYDKMYQAVNLLLERRFSKIGVIGGPLEEIWGKAFYEGCRAAFDDHNKKFLEQYYLFSPGYQNPEEAAHSFIEMLIELFQQKEPPDALIFPAELSASIQMFRQLNPELLHKNIELIGIAFDACQRDFPCISSNPSEMVQEALALLDLEHEKRAHAGERRFIKNSFFPEKNSQKISKVQNKQREETLV